MASLSRSKEGAYRITITKGEKQTVIYLGKMTGKSPAKTAERILSEVDTIISCNAAGQSYPPETSTWLAKIDDTLHSKLVKAGLIDERTRAVTLAAFLDTFKAGRDWNTATRRTWESGGQYLLDFFGDVALDKITANKAADYRIILTDSGLAVATVSKRIHQAKSLFNEARRRGLITVSPFENIIAGGQRNNQRHYFVSVDEVNLLLDACNAVSERAIIILARYGGLRCPSELTGLKWSEIDWSKKRFIVHSPKTEHQGKPYRIVPLFPEIETALTELWDTLPEGADDTVFTKLPACLGTWIRTRAKTAGLVLWDKPLQNMRSTRATELIQQYPSHVVNAIMGHTEAVAMGHYRQVLDDDFTNLAALETATGTHHKTRQEFVNDSAGNGLTGIDSPAAAPAVSQCKATPCNIMQFIRHGQDRLA